MMKKTLIACAIAAGTSVAAMGAYADVGHGGGFHGGGFHGGGNFHGGDFHGGHFGRGFHGHGFHGRGFRGFGTVVIGAPFFWPGYYYDYPPYSYYDSPSYYDYPTQVYVEPPAPSGQPQVQYYCPDTGYYPTVQTCPRGWLRVVPDNAPPQY
jgi:hypothetical protein